MNKGSLGTSSFIFRKRS